MWTELIRILIWIRTRVSLTRVSSVNGAYCVQLVATCCMQPTYTVQLVACNWLHATSCMKSCIVYVGLKSEKLSGKAVLKGKISVQSFSESVDLGGNGGLERSPVQMVHHLAGKALIKDWEREGKEKREIVKLSVESSVVSSHTAFIAVNEEDSDPIKGALQTWDLQAHYTRGYMYPFGGAVRVLPNSMGERTLGCSSRKREKKRKRRSSSRSRDRRKRSRSRGCESIELGMDDTELLDYDEEDLKLEDYEEEDLKSANTAPSSEISLSAIIRAQQADGSWLLSSELAKFVGKMLEEVKSGCPSECEGVVGGVWATLLMLELLHSRFSDNQEEWELVGTKAESWIKKQNLSRGASLDQLKSAAKKFA